MLEQIHIRNFALIEEIRLEFAPGLNILTGETGAGKSIILGALNSILGERVTADSIRSGADKASIEVLFTLKDNPDVERLLAEAGIPFDDRTLIIRREISTDGKNRVFINNVSATLTKLKELGDFLVDIHGQHEHQSLLQVDSHVRILDQFGKLDAEREEYSKAYASYFGLVEQRAKLVMDEQEKERRMELLRHAIAEIDEAKLVPGEESELDETVRKLSHAEKLFEGIDGLYETLYGSEDSLLARLSKKITDFEKVVPYDKTLAQVQSRLEGIRAEMQDISELLRDYRQNSELDPGRLDALIGRQEMIASLKRKYGKTVEAVLEYRQNASQDLDKIIHNTEELARLDKEIAEARKRLCQVAMTLSGRRHVVARVLEDRVNKELQDLAMKGARFEIQFAFSESPDGIIEENGKKYRITRTGMDMVEFLISTNVGEEPKPLRKIVSGGELSRIMLALKKIFAEADQIGTMVFDEIDTGISGETALVVGQKLKAISEAKQVICITHLPQIAAKSDRHFTVVKEIKGDRTITSVLMLSEVEKLKEIARIMKGDKITEATLEHARELIGS
jgi:DNA repair protein RecN (Recombination protein N)